jgi:hypothetical protein
MNTKNKAVMRLTIIVIAIALLIIAILSIASNFNFVDYLVKLHGG